ncbi:hypothetical protein OSB04_022395 [Centaurea solstitialis]|uniref:Dirigent protein n=1 Tax=Centaurea solstitialis TaxID=347529 RepID=A0AA38TEF5_9ASTR|nr:hypothetical protein OSB04_022395 [Centaurea solstitialis]
MLTIDFDLGQSSQSFFLHVGVLVEAREMWWNISVAQGSIPGVRNNQKAIDPERLAILEELIQNVSLSNSEDSWIWEGDPSGIFSVRSLRNIIDNVSNSPFAGITFWNKWLPPRVNCFVWRLLKKRIPTKPNLMTRGINLPSDLCPLCNMEKETEVHLFFSCPKVIDVWIWVSNWCGVELGHINSLDQLIFNLLDGSNSDRKRRFSEAVAGTTLWLIWKFRNNLVFNHKSFSASIVATEVQASLFTWLKYRAKCKNFKNATAAIVGAPAWGNNTILANNNHFGNVVVFDDPITLDNNLHSPPVGRAQGFYIYDKKEIFTAWLGFSFVFNSTAHRGSINFAGADPLMNKTRDISVIGGTGDFFMTRGVATIMTDSFEGEVHLDFTQTTSLIILSRAKSCSPEINTQWPLVAHPRIRTWKT